MNVLLDTQILLWSAGASDRLPSEAIDLINDPVTSLAFSAASLWEISIKNSLKKSDFYVDPHLLRRGLLEHGYEEMAVTGAHAVAVDLLPPIHKDPFDRILVAQAQVERFTLLTADTTLGQYPGPIRLLD